jgi:phosphate transport system substrate-binding protein
VHVVTCTHIFHGKFEFAEVEVWGSPGDAELLKRWEDGFKRVQPGVHFTGKMRGPDSTMAGVYTGVAQLAFLSREIWPVETMAYEWVYRFKPTGIQVMTAGLNNDRVSASLVVVVNKSNPVTQLSITQLDAIFGAEHRRSAKNLRTWGDAGALGVWARRPIHAYGPSVDSAPAYYFDQAVLKNSRKWNCDLKEFGDERDPKLASVVEVVAHDPDGIGYAVMRDLKAGVKTLALAGTDGSAAVAPSAATVRTRAYPLSRPLSLYFYRKPGEPLDAKLGEFLRFILSEEGQHTVLQDGAYEPLTPAMAADQRARLD